jgi:negative regulator of genetic competence, sporulation and motility
MSATKSWGAGRFRGNHRRWAKRYSRESCSATFRVEALEERTMMSAVSPVAGWLNQRLAAYAADRYETDNSFAASRAITLNSAAQTHSIHALGDADFVKFTLAGTTNVVLATAGSSGDTELRLYNSSGILVASNNDYNGTFSRISGTLAAGTYYARVNEYGNNTTIAAYTLQLTGSAVIAADAYEVDNTLAQAKAITLNAAAQTHSIHATGDADYARFTLTTTTNVVLTTAGVAGDTELTLYNWAGAQLASNNDANGTFAQLSGTLTAGTYYARVNEYGNNAAIAAYTLQLTGTTAISADAYEVDNTLAQAKAITLNAATQTHSIHTIGDADYVTFTLTATTDVILATAGSSGDTELTLYSASGVQLAYNNDSNGSFAQISASLAAGTYYARVNEYGNNATIGGYSLQLVTALASDAYEVDNTLAQAKAITLNAAAQTHNIHTIGDADGVKFTLPSATNVVLATGGVSGDTELRLYNATGTQLAYNNDYGSSFARISGTLAAGTYYARVNENGNNAMIAAYTLQLTGSPALVSDAYEVDNTLAQAKTIVLNGSAQTHNIHAAGDVDYAKFTLTTVTDVVLTTAGAAGDTELALYNSAGTRVAYNNDYSGTFSQISARLVAGTYYARVNEYGNNATIAAYALQLTGAAVATSDVYEVDNTLAQAKTIALNGAAQTHSIHTASDVDWVKFTLATATSVVVKTAGSSGDTDLTLYDAAGTQLAYNNDYTGTFSQISSTLAAGTYYAKVGEYGNNATIATYSLSLSGTTSTSTTNYMLYAAWGGTWTDVDKGTTNTDDDLLCWAATTSNMLRWSGWGNAGGLTSADAIFSYFQAHWSDQGGHQYYGADWWFDGTNAMQGVSGWAQVEVAGGGFYPAQNYGNYIHYSSTLSSTMATISSYLHSGYAVGLGLSGPGGHAITCWGYEFTAGDTANFKGVYVTDSDDNQSAPTSDYLKYYTVAQSNGRWYLQNYYGSNSWYISDVTGLDRRPSGVSSASVAQVAANGVAARATLSRFCATAFAEDVQSLGVQAGAVVEQLVESTTGQATPLAETQAVDAVVDAALRRTTDANPQGADQGLNGDPLRETEQVVALLQETPAHLQRTASDAVFQAYR